MCGACGHHVNENQPAVSYDVRVHPLVNGPAEYMNRYGRAETGKHDGAKQDSVSVMMYHSHAAHDCIESVNDMMVDAVLKLKNLAFVRVHARIGSNEFGFSLKMFEGCLGIALKDKGTHNMLEAHHDNTIVAVLSTSLEDRIGFSIPVLVSPDDELVAEFTHRQAYQAVLQKAELKFEVAGGYEKAWSVRLNALVTHYVNTSFKI